jgi:hypothetical protein
VATRKRVRDTDLITSTWGIDRIRTLLRLDDKATVLPNGKPLKPMKITYSQNFGELFIMMDLLANQQPLTTSESMGTRMKK